MPPSPQLVFLGYYPKRIYVPKREGVDWTSPVVEICSVSDCISEGASPESGDAYFDFNRVRFYSTPEAAIAAADPQLRQEYEPFALSLYPGSFDSDGAPVFLDFDVFLPTGERLPTNGPDPSFKPIGFDVVQFDLQVCWGCSPLSCNGYAGEFQVNRYCLIDDFDSALRLCKVCQQTQPEPGDYVIIEVRRANLST